MREYVITVKGVERVVLFTETDVRLWGDKCRPYVPGDVATDVATDVSPGDASTPDAPRAT